MFSRNSTVPGVDDRLFSSLSSNVSSSKESLAEQKRAEKPELTIRRPHNTLFTAIAAFRVLYFQLNLEHNFSVIAIDLFGTKVVIGFDDDRSS